MSPKYSQRGIALEVPLSPKDSSKDLSAYAHDILVITGFLWVGITTCLSDTWLGLSLLPLKNPLGEKVNVYEKKKMQILRIGLNP